jgi:hypothetical protein
MGKQEGQCLTTGWEGGRDRIQRAYFLCLLCRRMEMGGRVASLCSAMVGVERNVFWIQQSVAFYCVWRRCMKVFYPIHQMSAPKSDLERTHVWYSEWVAEGDRPVSCFTRLQSALKDLDGAISFAFT